MQNKPSKTPPTELTNENAGAGALGGAAVGAVAALGLASASVLWPLVLAGSGAVVGALLGRAISTKTDHGAL